MPDINKQLAQFNFDCGAKDMMLLRDPRFYSTHIRLQGLELASGNSCSSLGVGISLLKEAAKQRAASSANWGLTADRGQIQYRAGDGGLLPIRRQPRLLGAG